MKLLRNNQSGFTLVELMVVVAIIGILATLAIPQYNKFQAKARQSEAKIALSGLSTAEETYRGENGSYTTAFNDLGFTLTGNKRYYTVGFAAAVTPPVATTSATASLGGGPSIPQTVCSTVAIASTGALTLSTYTAAANGIVSGACAAGNGTDVWTMTNLNELRNTVNGTNL
jgi:type IV pilus assembly protein PilA